MARHIAHYTLVRLLPHYMVPRYVQHQQSALQMLGQRSLARIIVELVGCIHHLQQRIALPDQITSSFKRLPRHLQNFQRPFRSANLDEVQS